MIKTIKKNTKSLFVMFNIFVANISFAANEIVDVSKGKSIAPIESLMPMLLGLAAILLIIFGLAYLFRKFSNFGLSGKNIQVLETQMIGAKEKLVIIKVQEQQFLIGVTGHTISQLGELKTPINLSENRGTNSSTSVSPNHQQNSFSHIISSLIKGESIVSKVGSPKHATMIKDI